MLRDIKPFPVPVVPALGPGSQAEDETLDYITLPQGMQTYRPPSLPEPEEVARHAGAVHLLQDVLTALRTVTAYPAPHSATASIALTGLSPEELTLVNQVLGEGEVSAQVLAEDGTARVQVQESVFAGVWRVIETLDDGVLRDQVVVGAVPAVLRQAALADGSMGAPAAVPAPPQIMNAPSVLVELEDQRRSWRAGQRAHVVNLSLLPLTSDGIGYLDLRLGTGRVLMLSRGYGNCRITNCRVPNTWRVVYYNSMDTVILNSVEVTDMPEVACAAPEDLCDSAERMDEVLKWVSQ